MNETIRQFIITQTKATEIAQQQILQTLWSGYGAIIRVALLGSEHRSIIVKYVSLPNRRHHPRGWNSDLSHQRKVTSYQVEMGWYRDWASQCTQDCRVPAVLGVMQVGDDCVMLLEDLDLAGYHERVTEPVLDDIRVCVRWLANFHARFLGLQPTGLWPVGTYWHLDTRPEEWAALAEGSLKQQAAVIDQRLRDCPYQTIVHGDAKLANFCFSTDRSHVAAVDFQYVGAGCGMKDLAYLMSSFMDEAACDQHDAALLDEYFSVLSNGVEKQHPQVDIDELVRQWRQLYPVAWADFYRFLKGWCPDHWKIHAYSKRLAAGTMKDMES